MINEVIIVEGIHDQQKLNSIYPDIECIVTNGSEISEATLNLIEQIHNSRGVILFLDPDFPGKQITNKILDRINDVKIAFLIKQKAISKNHRKVGVEHAQEADIREALDHLFVINNRQEIKITMTDLANIKLVNCQSAFVRRKFVCEALMIPVCNGKTFLRYINMLDISLSRIVEVMS
ncbi:MAG: ribonuclease M5 [Candidatus Izemoplasmatales bacterium]